MYTTKNFTSKKALKEAVAAFVAGTGPAVGFYSPGIVSENARMAMAGGETTISLEGPHYPQPHRWYASATVKDGSVVKVKA